MFKGISEKIVKLACERDIIHKENVEEYTYGINSFFIIGLNLLTVAVIGIITNMLAEIIVFVAIFKSLRKYVGGYHSDTPLQCYVTTCCIYAIILLTIRYYSLPYELTPCFAVLSAVIMLLLSPVEAIKKPLDELERKVFRRRAYIRIVLTLALFMLLYLASGISQLHYYYSVIIMISMSSVAIFTVMGKIKLIRYEKNTELSV